MTKSILTTWAIVLIVVGVITALDFEKRDFAAFRILFPAFGVVVIYLLELANRIELKKKGRALGKRLLAIPFLCFGFNWICIFTLTTYREHRRPEIIPLSILCIGLGLWLTHSTIAAKKVHPGFAHPE